VTFAAHAVVAVVVLVLWGSLAVERARAQDEPPPTPIEVPTVLPPAEPPPALDPTRLQQPAPPVSTSPSPGTMFVPPQTVPATAGAASTLPSLILPSSMGLLSIRPGASVVEEYSDDFNLASPGRVENFRTAVLPAVDIKLNSAFTKGSVAYTLGVVHDSSASDAVDFHHRLAAQLAWEATPRLKFTIVEDLTRSDEPSLADRLSLRQQRGLFTANTVIARSEYRIDRVATTASYRFTTFATDEDNQETTTHAVNLTASIPVYATNTITAIYDYSVSDTVGAAAPESFITGIGAGASRISGHRLTAAVQRVFTPSLTAGVSGSYALREETQEGRDENFDSWSVSVFNRYAAGSLSLTGALGYSETRRSGGTDATVTTTTLLTYTHARGTLTLGVDSGFAETFAEGQNVGVIQTRGIIGSLLYRLTPSLTATVSGYFRQNEPTGESGSTNRRQTTWNTTASLSYRLTKRVEARVEYSHRDQSAGGGSAPFVENLARISLHAQY
jgi:hypothetical protein